MGRMSRRHFLSRIGAAGAAFLLAEGTGAARPTAASKRSGLMSDDLYLEHETGEFHPESPARLLAIRQRLDRSGWAEKLLPLTAREATAEEVQLVHDDRYVELVRRECDAGAASLSTGDTAIGARSYTVALKAAGGVLAAVDAVMAGRVKNAFCIVRPPGHHASQARGMGFCIFNNVAIAARYAQKKFGLERVLIADWDVHHGNGTQDIFWSDGSVFFMSTHQWPFYPGTGQRGEIGSGKGRGLIMNRPFFAGAGNREIGGAFSQDLLPAARSFKPDLTLISAGFDSRRGDPLGGFQVDDQGFRELTRIMIEIAHISGRGRLVSVLEGGYGLSGLATAACAHLDELSRA